MISIGIVGCGTIGTEIAKAIDKKVLPAKLSAVCDVIPDKIKKLKSCINLKPVSADIQKLVRKSDVVVESAGVSSVEKIAKECIKQKKPLLVMSAGYFLLDPSLIELAKKKKCRIIFPSGAIAGIDALKAAKIGGVDSAVLTTTKPPGGLKGAPYFDGSKIDLEKIDKPTVVFEGNAVEALKGFPKNINVSAVLSLAGIGPKKTIVKIIADPAGTRNVHEIEIKGRSGVIRTCTENVPSPSNPKTSYLAVLSAISVLQQFCE